MPRVCSPDFVMAIHSSALLSLCRCLRGVLPSDPDWFAILGLANETLTTPALIDFVNRFQQSLPEEVGAYVREIHRRNEVRNQRLTAQLTEAVVALNNREVTPVLLKGAATLVTASRAQASMRLMADIDLLVPPEQTQISLQALADIGYVVHFQTPAASEKWCTDLKRPQDVGMIDLHRTLPGPAYFYRPAGDILENSKLTSIGAGSAYVPTAAYQALLLTMHDQFQDYDYWVGGIDLRHLLQLRDLVNSPDGLDWIRLAGYVPGKLARNALETQLIALTELLGVDVPASMRGRRIPRLQFKRRVMQARFPLARWPLLAAAVLDYRNYRCGLGAEYRGAGQSGSGTWAMPKPETFRFIMERARAHRVGKV